MSKQINSIIFITAILIFIILFALKMQNNMEGMDYYQDKIKESQERINLLEKLNSNTDTNQQEEGYISQ